MQSEAPLRQQRTSGKSNGPGQLGRQIHKHRYLYLLLLPAFTAVFIFSYLPLNGLVMAFKEIRFNQSVWAGDWIGFQYFRDFFSNFNTPQLIRNTITIAFLKIVVAFPFPIMFALIINEVRATRFKRVAQTISYLPNFLSWVVVISIVERLFAPSVGLVNQIIQALGGSGNTFFMMETSFFYPSVFFTYVWKNIGWDSIIYLAAISGIDPALYEAANIDGANRIDEMRYITLPSIRFVIGINFILALGGILSAGFDQIYLLRTPGNMHIADILDTYVIREGLEKGRYGYATAVGLIQSVVGTTLVLTSNKISSKVTDVSLY